MVRRPSPTFRRVLGQLIVREVSILFMAPAQHVPAYPSSLRGRSKHQGRCSEAAGKPAGPSTWPRWRGGGSLAAVTSTEAVLARHCADWRSLPPKHEKSPTRLEVDEGVVRRQHGDDV